MYIGTCSNSSASASTSCLRNTAYNIANFLVSVKGLSSHPLKMGEFSRPDAIKIYQSAGFTMLGGFFILST